MARSFLNIKVTGLKKFQDQFNKIIIRALNRTFMLELAKFSSEMLYKRVKSGKGVVDDQVEGPKQKPLARLSKKYVNYRKLRTDKLIGEFASPGKSNATFTGQMLRSFKTSARNFGFEMKIPDSPRTDSESSNAEVAKYYSEKRPFFQLSDKELRQITVKAQNQVRKQLRARSSNR